MTVWLTADTHYDHKNIIKYSARPFRDVDHMNEILIQNWNRVVKPGDLVYCLGDFCLGTEERAIGFAKRLNGNKYLIWGNHDKRLRKSEEFRKQWIWCEDIKTIEVGSQKAVLCHFALRTWHHAHKGNWHFYGHSHNSLPDDPNALSMDVGVDVPDFDYTPVAFEDLGRYMKKKTFKPIDHHE